MISESTRVKCSSDGQFHKVTFFGDGTVTKDGVDITEEAKRFAAMVRLGRAPGDYGTVVALAALVMTGCEAIMRRPADEYGEVRDLGAWDDIYTRWEQVRIVEAEMEHWKHRLRREAKKAKVSPPDTSQLLGPSA
jgi:hypothetical protein